MKDGIHSSCSKSLLYVRDSTAGLWKSTAGSNLRSRKAGSDSEEFAGTEITSSSPRLYWKNWIRSRHAGITRPRSSWLPSIRITCLPIRADSAIPASRMRRSLRRTCCWRRKNAGVDSCWVNYFNPEDMARLLNLPENEEVLMVLDLGYAAEGFKALPAHSQRKRLPRP